MTYDFELQNHFSIYVLTPLTEEGRDWIDYNVGWDIMWGDGIVIEPRYVEDIMHGIATDGLTTVST